VKYIVIRTPNGEAPILFPRELIHRWVAGTMAPMPVVAAGFVRLDDGRPRCFGASESLNLRSRPERDSTLVGQALGERTVGQT
jgi:hypothetical protein